MMRRRLPALTLGWLACCVAQGCARRVAPPPPVVSPPPATSTAAAFSEVGTASWYGHPYHGRPTASGEIYDMNDMTAAHRTLAFGSKVRVHNLENSRSVDVRINDRGPFVGDRIIDLSYRAAGSIGMIAAGLARVRLELVSEESEPPDPAFAVQVGAFRNRSNADELRRDMEARYGTAEVRERSGNPILWRVLVGRVGSLEDARRLLTRIRALDPAFGAAFVVRRDE